MTEAEQAAAIREIALELGAETVLLKQEIVGKSTLEARGDEAASGPLRPLDGLLTGQRPGIALTVKIDPDAPLQALVALTDSADAEVGEWAIFRGWAAGFDRLPSRLVTSPARELRFFANPRTILGYVVYQRVAPEGDDVFTLGDLTPSDEAAAARA